MVLLILFDTFVKCLSNVNLLSNVNPTLSNVNHGFLCIVEHYVEVFTKCFGRKAVCLVVWCHSGKDETGRFLEALILCKALCGNFKGNSILVCDITWYRPYSLLFLYIFFDIFSLLIKHFAVYVQNYFQVLIKG